MYRLLFVLLSPLYLFSDVFLTAPTDLVFKDRKAHSVTVTWLDRSDNEQGFKVFRDEKLIYITKENVTSFTDRGLKAGKSYIYTIKATNIARHKLLPPKDDNQIYFGAEAGYREGSIDTSLISSKIQDFDTKSKKKIMWAYISDIWSHWESRGTKTYPRDVVQSILDEDKKVVFMRMMPLKEVDYVSPMNVLDATVCKRDNNCVNSTYKLIDIATSPVIEEMIRDWAKGAKKHFEDAKADGKAFYMMIDFSPEMNGYWFAWSDVHQSADDYKKAYRKFVDIFREEKVPHITWVFHPDLTNKEEWNWLGTLTAFKNHERWAKPSSYYPGDDYVDWIGFSRYGKVEKLSDENDYPSFFTKMDSFDEQIASLNPTKPIMLTETAVTENPYDENAKKVWLSGMFADIKSRSRIKGISYWNESWGTKTNIGTSPVSLKSFSDGIKSPVFINQPNISFVGD
jgi:hypothetical protein